MEFPVPDSLAPAVPSEGTSGLYVVLEKALIRCPYSGKALEES